MEKLFFTMKLKFNRRVIVSIGLGFLLAGFTLGAGASLLSMMPGHLILKHLQIIGLFGLVTMDSVVSGYYLGLGITLDDSTSYLLASYFSVTLLATIALEFRSHSILYYSPILLIVIAFMIYNRNVEPNMVSGAALNLTTKIFLIITCIAANAYLIVPILSSFLGYFSYISYAWVVLVSLLLVYRFSRYMREDYIDRVFDLLDYE